MKIIYESTSAIDIHKLSYLSYTNIIFQFNNILARHTHKILKLH